MCFLRSLLHRVSQSRKPFCKSAAVLTFPKLVFRWLTKDKALYFLLCEGSHDKGRVSPPPTKRGTRPAPKPGSVMAVNKNPFKFQPLSAEFYLFLEQYLFVFVMSGSIFIVVKIILPLNVNFIRISLILNSMTVVKHTIKSSGMSVIIQLWDVAGAGTFLCSSWFVGCPISNKFGLPPALNRPSSRINASSFQLSSRLTPKKWLLLFLNKAFLPSHCLNIRNSDILIPHKLLVPSIWGAIEVYKCLIRG